MSYKPQIVTGRHYLTRKAAARARRTAKKASTRLMRRAAKNEPENAPTRRIVGGWMD